MQQTTDTTIPQVNTVKNKKLYAAFYQAIQKQLLASSISVTRGGLAMALAKKAIGGMLGLECRLKTYLATPAVTILHFIRKAKVASLSPSQKKTKRLLKKSCKGMHTHKSEELPKIPNSSSKACKKKS